MNPYRSCPPPEDDAPAIRAWARQIRMKRWRTAAAFVLALSFAGALSCASLVAKRTQHVARARPAATVHERVPIDLPDENPSDWATQ